MVTIVLSPHVELVGPIIVLASDMSAAIAGCAPPVDGGAFVNLR